VKRRRVPRPDLLSVTIYHNPQCSTSRKTLELIREAGIEPVVIEYRQTGWTKALLKSLFKAMKAKPRDLLRVNGTPAEELGLTNPSVTDDRLLAAMIEHPILVQRPIVVTDKSTILARPQEKVLEIL
jgi:arsenate reductase